MIARKGEAWNISPVVDFQTGINIKTISRATPGSQGKVRLKYKTKRGALDKKGVANGEPKSCKFFHTINIQIFPPERYIWIIVEAGPLKGNKIAHQWRVALKTAASKEMFAADVNFIVSNGKHLFWNVDSDTGYKI